MPVPHKRFSTLLFLGGASSFYADLSHPSGKRCPGMSSCDGHFVRHSTGDSPLDTSFFAGVVKSEDGKACVAGDKAGGLVGADCQEKRGYVCTSYCACECVSMSSFDFIGIRNQHSWFHCTVYTLKLIDNIALLVGQMGVKTT